MNKKFSKAEFGRQLAANQVVLSLVGMSNSGKSYWSEQLAQGRDFKRICCDNLIESELGGVLSKLGYKGINDMSKWLGQPYEERFAVNQQTYLDLESATIEAILRELEQKPPKTNLVIDTTGSVVHLGEAVRNRLHDLSLVVYLQAPPGQEQEMFERYLAEPKPVVFGDMYRPEPGEDSQTALARCYKDLLAYRNSLYEAMADVVIPSSKLASIASSSIFLDLIADSLL